MKTAAIYARVSTQGQARDGTSLDTQTDACRQFAREHGYGVISEVAEDFTGTSLARPGLDQVRDMAVAGEIEVVIVYDPDRLSRSNAHTWVLLDEFERRQVELLFVNAPREDTPEGRMLFGMRALFAEYERAKILERTRRGKERRAREGKILGTPLVPYGYRYVRGQGRFELVPEEAAWVVGMFEWYVEGYNLVQVARKLNELGVPTKRGAPRWTSGTVHKMLSNETYAGRWTWNKNRTVVPMKIKQPANPNRKWRSSARKRGQAEWVHIAVPAVVSRELFEAAQERFERNKRFAVRNTGRQYLLRGLMSCPCGRRMVGCVARGRLHYRCWRRGTGEYDKSEQHAGYIPAPYLEAQVWGEVVRQLGTRELVRQYLAHMRVQLTDETAAAAREREALLSRDAKLRAQEDRLLEVADQVSRDALLKRLAELRKHRASIARSLADLKAAPAEGPLAPAIDLGSLEIILDHLTEDLPSIPFEEKRAYLELFNVEGRIEGDRLWLRGLPEEVSLPLRRGRAA